MFWKFRYFLSDDPEALPKFLKAVKWTNRKFSDEALLLIEKWTPAKYDDALFLLSRTFSVSPEYQSDLEIDAEEAQRVFKVIR